MSNDFQCLFDVGLQGLGFNGSSSAGVEEATAAEAEGRGGATGHWCKMPAIEKML